MGTEKKHNWRLQTLDQRSRRTTSPSSLSSFGLKRDVGAASHVSHNPRAYVAYLDWYPSWRCLLPTFTAPRLLRAVVACRCRDGGGSNRSDGKPRWSAGRRGMLAYAYEDHEIVPSGGSAASSSDRTACTLSFDLFFCASCARHTHDATHSSSGGGGCPASVQVGSR